jgi:hypothetical protein
MHYTFTLKTNRISEFPGFSFPFLRIVFISCCNFFIIKIIIILFRNGINQISVWISSNPMAVLVWFVGRLLISIDGTKNENTT